MGEAAAPASAGSSWAYDLAGELMSPFCPGRTVASCPSPQATELIQWIAMQEAAGATREEVIAMLVERHGEEILGAPPAKGITLWAYVFPVLGFAAFGAIAVRVLRRIVAPAAPASSASAAPSEGLRRAGAARVPPAGAPIRTSSPASSMRSSPSAPSKTTAIIAGFLSRRPGARPVARRGRTRSVA